VTLKPCVAGPEQVCAAKEEQKAFYKGSPTLHFLFIDNSIDLKSDATKLF
jgi:hypothetical protein